MFSAGVLLLYIRLDFQFSRGVGGAEAFEPGYTHYAKIFTQQITVFFFNTKKKKLLNFANEPDDRLGQRGSGSATAAIGFISQ